MPPALSRSDGGAGTHPAFAFGHFVGCRVHQNAPKCTKTHHFFDFFSLLSDRLTPLRASPHLVLRLAAEAATPVVPTPRGAVLSRTLFLNSKITIIPFATYSIILIPLHTITKHADNAIDCLKNLAKIRNVHIFSEFNDLFGIR